MAIVAVELAWTDLDDKCRDNYENIFRNGVTETGISLEGGGGEEFMGWLYIGDLSSISMVITDTGTQAFEAKVYGVDHIPDVTFADNRAQLLGAALAVGADSSVGEYYLGKWQYLLFTAKHSGGAKANQVVIDAYGKMRQ